MSSADRPLWDETLAPWPTRPDGSRYAEPWPRHYAEAMAAAPDARASMAIFELVPQRLRELVLEQVHAAAATRTLRGIARAEARTRAASRGVPSGRPPARPRARR